MERWTGTGCDIPKPEYPRPEKRREKWMNLNGPWDFRLFPAGEEAQEKAFAKERGAYEERIQVPFSWGCPLSGIVRNEIGIGWYRRTVDYHPKERLFLCFGAVDYLADVYVNGQFLCHHEGGYTCFEAEVTALWQPGDNLIEVRAEDYSRENQQYGKQDYGRIQGIWQTVWLEERPQAYIQDWRVVTHLDGLVEISVQAQAPDGALVSARFDGVEGAALVNDGKARLTLRLPSPHWWSPDDPYLYEGSLNLGEDQVFTYFGVREISVGCVGGRDYQWILLNGKPLYLNGTLDQAFHPQGYFTYPSDEAMHNEAWRLKRLGLNMVRIHIKAEEPRKLYWMDKVGVLVMADIPCFWGPPDATARRAFEDALPCLMQRDVNHPAIFSWVVFNETWGLFNKDENGKKVYLTDTQEWVRRMYHEAKRIDPTRLVEDNSPCNRDHVETDLNTWHFYLNSYDVVREHIDDVVKNTFPGSAFNFIGDNRQTNAPLMNSECGMVWGVDDSAGDSDIAWQYHYMLNQFRLHEKLCGFVFTEFHDVVNEFNGYYRIDDMDKDFGYQDFCRGMTLRDLHAADFVATDCPPTRTVQAGERVETPLVLSSFSDAHHGKQCTLGWEIWHEGLQGRVSDGAGAMPLPAFGYGVTALGSLGVEMPKENALAILSLYLMDDKGAVISRNFVTFDVRAALPPNQVEIPVCAGQTEGFDLTWTALGEDKMCLGGQGQVTYEVALPTGSQSIREMTLYLEASSKRILSKDRNIIGESEPDLGFMRGYRVDRGAFANSYWMTDGTRFPSQVEVLVNGERIHTLTLENDWADARGVLSWHRQPNPRKLDEAGSYGEHKRLPLPSRLLPAIARAGKLTLTFRVVGAGGLALYGRACGRYAHGLMLEIN